MRFWDVTLMSWVFQLLLNFLFIILPVHAKELGLRPSDVGVLFAINIGMRFFPNFLVTRIGAIADLVMMLCTLAGYVIAFFWPRDVWSLYILVAGAGWGFTRPCISLHAQRASKGDLDALSLASQRCGAARSLGDICAFVIPPAVYSMAGWTGLTAVGAGSALLYLLLALCQVEWAAPAENQEAHSLQIVEEESKEGEIAWIDWAISAAFISTEWQLNMFISAVPQTLIQRFEINPTAVGILVAAGSLGTLVYILILPSLPAAFNQRRPTNLLISYTGMFLGWMGMLGLMYQPQPAAFLMAVYFFQAVSGASQIVMLECLTGVCSSESSAKILGLSEMVGCAFGMAGGYGGAALLELGMEAPFAVSCAASLLSVAFLMLSFGLRRRQVKACLTLSELSDKGLFMEMTNGSREILMGHVPSANSDATRPRGQSYISAELQHRASPESKVNTDMPSILEDSIFADVAWSTARARLLKRLMTSFEHSMIELDSSDYEIREDLIAAGANTGRRTFSFDVHPRVRADSWEPLRLRSQSDR